MVSWRSELCLVLNHTLKSLISKYTDLMREAYYHPRR